jgi:hypothetical protein
LWKFEEKLWFQKNPPLASAVYERRTKKVFSFFLTEQREFVE